MRSRRTKSRIEQLEAQIHAVLAEDHPQSVRHVFYRMTDPRLPEPVEKSERGYRHVQERMAQMRRNGDLPYEWITDATRRGYHVATFDNAADFLRRTIGLYRADLWSSSPDYVEVWVESRSIAGVIENDCRELAVSLYPAGGFTSITLAYQSAEYITAATNDGEKAAHVIYIGDWDPAGVLIDQSIERELRKHLHPDVDLTFHRIAINLEQISAFDLPTKPRKSGDKRALHVESTVEAEAMPASMLRALLRREIEGHLPAHALLVAKAAEESERKSINLAARMLETEAR